MGTKSQDKHHVLNSPLSQTPIQASYDGKQLTLQFSQLWSFERNKTAPVELFCHYLLCEAVGLETSTLWVR